MLLEQFAVTQLFAFFLVFCRLGSAVMLLPGIGEAYISMRVRLLFALALSLVLTPVLGPLMPALPGDISPLVALIVSEIVTGIFFGALARMLISAMHTAGTLIAMQSGLAAAMQLDITQTSQSTSLTNLLSITALVLMFATNLHHMILTALVDSYTLFAPGHMPSPGDMVDYSSHTLSQVFGVAIQIASPHIAVGTIVYLSAGVLARLMPTMQVFFIIMSPQLMVNYLILMMTLSGSMMWYMGYLDGVFSNFLDLK